MNPEGENSTRCFSFVSSNFASREDDSSRNWKFRDPEVHIYGFDEMQAAFSSAIPTRNNSFWLTLIEAKV